MLWPRVWVGLMQSAQMYSGARTGVTGMWDTTGRGSFGCKLFRACGSRRVRVSPVGSVMCFAATCDAGQKLSRRAPCWGSSFTSVCATSLCPLAGRCWEWGNPSRTGSGNLLAILSLVYLWKCSGRLLMRSSKSWGICCSGVGHTGDIGGSEWADREFFLPKKLG